VISWTEVAGRKCDRSYLYQSIDFKEDVVQKRYLFIEGAGV